MLYTLVYPSPIAGHSLNTFTAPEGAALDAGRQNFVVMSYSATSGAPKMKRSKRSNGTDPGGAIGWNIDEPYLMSGPTVWAPTTGLHVLKLQVIGSVIAADGDDGLGAPGLE